MAKRREGVPVIVHLDLVCKRGDAAGWIASAQRRWDMPWLPRVGDTLFFPELEVNHEMCGTVKSVAFFTHGACEDAPVVTIQVEHSVEVNGMSNEAARMHYAKAWLEASNGWVSTCEGDDLAPP